MRWFGPNVSRMRDRGNVAGLIRALRDHDYTVQVEAARALGEVGDPAAVDPLVVVLEDEQGQLLRKAAARALGQIGDTRAVPALVKCIPYDNPEVQAALETLGQDALCQALQHKSITVRAGAAHWLGELGCAEATEPLCHALRDESADVRKSAAASLRGIGDKRAVEPLCAALRDKESAVRIEAARALGGIRDERALEPLCAVLTDPDDRFCQSVVEALGKIGDPQAVPYLQGIIVRPPLHDVALEALARLKAPDACERLVQALADAKDRWGRGRWARALSDLGDRRALKHLVPLMIADATGDNVSAVTKLGGDETLALLLTAFEQPHNRNDTSARIELLRAIEHVAAPAAIDPLCEWIAEGATKTGVAEAARALGKIADPKAAPVLTMATHKLLNPPSDWWRTWSTEMLDEARFAVLGALVRLLPEGDATVERLAQMYLERSGRDDASVEYLQALRNHLARS